MKNKIIEIKEINSKLKRNSKSVNDVEKQEFDLGDLLLPPISFEDIEMPKAKVKEIEFSNDSLDFIPLEAKGALWKVEIPSKNAILTCNHLKGDSQFELCSNGNTYLFKEIHEVFDFLLSNKREKIKK